MVTANPNLALSLPDHTQLPDSDGTFVKNFQEHPQSLLLTSSILPLFNTIHPDGQYAIGQDCGIYWRLVEPPERGAESPDWFYVPNVPPLLNGKMRRSYVLWKEVVVPLIALEFVSGDGKEELDATSPGQSENSKPGKFWVYEQAVKIPFYGIYDVEKATFELYQLVNQRYQRCLANERGHYPIPGLGVELGLWHGEFMNQVLPWLRWWDSNGNLLLAGEERAEQADLLVEVEKQRADRADLLVEEEKQRAEEERQRADRADLLVEEEKQRAEEEKQRADRADLLVEEEKQRAEEERQRADRADLLAEEEKQRADREAQRSEQLAAKLRELGIDPDA
jgi:Uma2 family endonuclease